MTYNRSRNFMLYGRFSRRDLHSPSRSLAGETSILTDEHTSGAEKRYEYENKRLLGGPGDAA